MQSPAARPSAAPAFSRGELRVRRAPARAPAALFGWGNEEKKKEKEEQFRVQQELLARRKTGAWKGEVDTRRAKVSKYLRDPTFKKEVDEERRERLKKEADALPKRTGFRIIVPVNPIGIPEYETERFDLRLPYVDNGWVDPDADPVAQFKRFFKLGGKKEGEKGGDGKGKGK